MHESPETDGDPMIRRLLAESNVAESPKLLEGLRLLRSFRASPVPEPTGELAILLKTAGPPRQRTQRHRGLILSFALAGAMAAGTTGVAASSTLRLTSESFNGGATEPALPPHHPAAGTPAPAAGGR